MAIALAALVAGGCPDSATGEQPDVATDTLVGGDGDGAVTPDAPTGPSVAPSIKARVKYKDGARYATDLADALAVEREVMCLELGQYDCFDVVHRIALGGVEPYTLGVREPLETAPLTAPIAQDRVALAACAAGIDTDIARQTPVLLDGVTVGPAVPSPEGLAEVAGRLYDRILRRDATASEIAALVAFHDEVAADHGGAGGEATRDWAVLSCFAVATTLEALFY